ncbi:Tetratricopeptide repeat protein 37, partial [Dimargaris cristalligena]
MPTLTPSPLDSAHRAAAHAALACLSLRVQLRTLTLLSEFAAPAANLYFQLATLYYDYFREATTTTTTATTDSVDEEAATASSIAEQAWLISALQVNKAALQLQPILESPGGVVALSTSSSLSTAEADPRLAQHAFIRAVTVQPKNVSAWSNLGFLYLQHGELELANRVFTQIQNLDPEFVPVWAGQALLADQLGQPTEALALYRHAFTSIEGGAANGGGGGSSSGSGGGSPRHISEVNLLLAQSYWGAVAARHAAGNGGDGDALPPRTLVQFALEKFTERDPRQPWVWHQLDLLREADRRYEGAIGAYRIARELLAQRDEPRVNGEEGGLTTASPPVMVVLESNYARALCAGGHYTESVKIYTKLMESPYFVAATAEMEEEDEQQPQVDDTATTQQRRYL